ncbi:Gfo/Idh/MocA family protein [Novosphingobium piscinae]|uniref:Gfo/Idh/MocA family oxidoreductase n=1 Tax=Novosphingobium piscinae TaxID=1507448 RepID=A0A7X1FVJ5_9SPHN|nr:Gfo/Idh/MocA family oxidoreductase [Novosphingobium piscinae]
MATIRLAVIGLGKIARDQHLPAIAGDEGFVLAATVSPDNAGVTGVPHFASLDNLFAAGPAIDAVALCTPPQVRFDLARAALDRGLHVLLEKPPGATLGEVAALVAAAEASGSSLFTAWHSRYAAGVEPARAWLAARRIDRVRIVWREDVRVWHPGQDWIWQPGGLGVFDPGINALSIVTRILPRPLLLQDALLSFPANRAAPIAAELTLQDTAGTPVVMDLDFRQTGPQSWDIVVETDSGTLTLSSGGAVLALPGQSRHDADREYPALYRHFAELIAAGRSDVDVAPLRLVADAFLCGRRVEVAPFVD